MVALLGGCTGKAAVSGSPSSLPDAGTPPASAFDECPMPGQADASSFLYTATCALPGDDAGSMTSCQQWSESEDGDWTSFLESCETANGAITTVPCPDAGLAGVCVLPAGCTSQTTVFQYGAIDAASARTSCIATPGAIFSP